jgi:hypothetical protein
MVVNDFDIFGVAVVPQETHTPLIIDTDAPLACSTSPQSLQPVSRRHSQSVDGHGRVQHGELALRNTQKVRGKALGSLPIPHRLRPAPFEALDYATQVS